MTSLSTLALALAAPAASASSNPVPLPVVPPSPSFWMPTASSTSAGQVDWLFTTLMTVATVSAVGVFVAMALFVLRYRSRSREEAAPPPGVTHNTLLEVTWSVIPLGIVIALFFWGFKGYVDLRTAPKDSIEISVTGQKWKWLFTYPNGLTEDTLHVPVDTPVRVILTSQDVIHSLYIPAFRTKMDAVPGRYTDLWFQATEVGSFPIFCAEYCGRSHSDMHSTVIVHEPGGYEKWLETREQEVMNKPPAELGADLFQKQGCSTCHSVDGSPLVGPSLKGIFGHEVTLADGTTLTVDENYVRESILQPQAKIVKGFNPAMPTFQGKLDDTEITGLIEFIKTLK
jgi:cytochrome c oxidase subunit 2